LVCCFAALKNNFSYFVCIFFLFVSLLYTFTTKIVKLLANLIIKFDLISVAFYLQSVGNKYKNLQKNKTMVFAFWWVVL
jgi:hypothetical protein